jgi:hypothetical protein
MKIRFLTSQNVTAYRDLRLQALRESPTAFGSSYEQEVGHPLTVFAARLCPHNDSANGIFGAFDDSDQLIGMLGFSRESRPKRAHIGSLWSMYVLLSFAVEALEGCFSMRHYPMPDNLVFCDR